MGTSPWICANIKKTCVCMLACIAHLSCHLIWGWSEVLLYGKQQLPDTYCWTWEIFYFLSELFLQGAIVCSHFRYNTMLFPLMHSKVKPTPFVMFCHSIEPKIQILGRRKSSNNLTSSFLSHLASTRILTIQAESSASCYIRVLEAKGKEEMKQAQETANRKTSLKLPWIGDTHLFVLFYASGFLWNREE